MGNAVVWENHELSYLQQREWDIVRTKLYATDPEVTQLLKVFREIDYRGRGRLGRVEFYLHFKYPFITPMADKLFNAFTGGKAEMGFKEFVTSVLTVSMASTSTLINFLFDMYDTDGNKSMDSDELKACLEDIFGPPEQAEWFSILNDCTRSLVNKFTKMGEVELNKKKFREMIESNEPLMTYLPIFVLQRDMIAKTLGERVFSEKPTIEKMPHKFIETTYAMTLGERGREELQAKAIAELKAAEEEWRKEKMTRTSDGIRQLKFEELSHISFRKDRPPGCKPRKPRVVMVKSKDRFTLAKNRVVKEEKTPQQLAEEFVEDSRRKKRMWLNKRTTSNPGFSPKEAMIRSRLRSEKKALPFFIRPRDQLPFPKQFDAKRP